MPRSATLRIVPSPRAAYRKRRGGLALCALDLALPGNLTRHDFAGRIYVVMSWNPAAYLDLTAEGRALVDGSHPMLSPDGTRHLLMR